MDDLPSDLDLAVHPEDERKLVRIFRAMRDAGFLPIQCLNYFARAYYFVFAWFDEEELRTMSIDIIFEHRRSGWIRPSTEELMNGRRKLGDIWVLTTESQLTYLLIKQAWKGKATPSQGLRLREAVEKLGRTQAKRIAKEIFFGKCAELLIEACANGSLDRVLPRARSQLWWTSLMRHPANLIRYIWGEGMRGLRRWFGPTGLLIAVVGPDGAGKSSLIRQIRGTFNSAFRRERSFHWRPEVFATPGIKPPVTDPHAKPTRGGFFSTAFLIAFFLDYWVGYMLAIRPLLARSGLVLFDRYSHDVQADPRRYRYGGPRWLPRLLSRLVPTPDLVFLLDAGEEVIFRRKNELPIEEVRRQRRAFHQLRFRRAQTVTLKTDRGLDRTLHEASRVVAGYLTQRFERTQARWLRKV